MERFRRRVERAARVVGAAGLLFAQPGDTTPRVDRAPAATAPALEESEHDSTTFDSGANSDATSHDVVTPLSAEDETRRREHEKFRDEMMDKLSEALPPGFSVQVTTGIKREGDAAFQGMYDEFITIRGPQGDEYGQVYPDEGDGGHLLWTMGEDSERFLSAHGIHPEPYELSTPQDVSLMLDDVNTIGKLEQAEAAFDAEWPAGTQLVTHDDGTITGNQEYYDAREAFRASQSGTYAELAILQDDDEEEDDEEDEDNDEE